MGFAVLIPARLASTRLPGKPLADIGGLPMVVRVALRAAEAGADQVVVAGDDPSIVQACAAHGVRALLTRTDHASGSDRLAEACTLLGLDGAQVVVNVQGDEPLIEPQLIRQCAALLQQRSDCVMSTAAHPIDELKDYLDPNVVKVVLDAKGDAHVLQPRADTVAARWRQRRAAGAAAAASAAARGAVRVSRRLPACVSDIAAHGDRAHRGAGTAACAVAWAPHRRASSAIMRPAPVWTHRKTWSACARCCADLPARRGVRRAPILA